MTRAPAASHCCKVLFYVTVLWVTPCGAETQSLSPGCNLRIREAFQDYEHFQDGDIIIGGVLTVNIYGIDVAIDERPVKQIMCLTPTVQNYINILMLIFAIDKINQNPDILPNITLGYHAYDSCLEKKMVIRNVLQILSGPGKTIPNYSCTRHHKLAGFIGDHYSTTTVLIAQILGVYGYTQISYGATDYSLSDRRLYPHVFRTIQNDHVHYLAISKILKHFGWTWVGIIVSDDDSGENEIQILKRYLSDQGICVAFIKKINTFDRSNIDFLTEVGSRVAVFCGSFTVEIVYLIDQYRSPVTDIVFILPPSWASSFLITDNYIPEYTVNLAIEPSPIMIPGIESLFDNTHLLKQLENKTLLEEILVQELHCVSSKETLDTSFLDNRTNICPKCNMRDIIPRMKKSLHLGVSSRVYYAVDIMAKALHEMYLFHKGTNLKLTSNSFTYQLHHYIKEMKYSLNTPDMVPYLDEHGEFVYYYKIVNWISKNDTTMVENVVGNFTPWAPDDQQLLIDSKAIMWRFGRKEVPVSQCSDSCLPGTRKKPKSTIQPCCYDCAPCSVGEISNTTDSENCMKCPEDEWPNEKKDRCVPKQMEFLSYDDSISAVFSSCSVLLCLVTIFVMGICVSYLDTPIVKANNRSLSFVLLVSIMLSFLCVFLFLGRPVDVTCILRVSSFGVIFSISVSSLLGKTIMVYIAFRATKPGSSWRKWMGVRLPNSIVSLCSSVQCVICATWLAVSSPFQELDTQTYQGKIIIQCNEGSVIGFYSVLGYMGFLAAVSFVLAFMVRTLPDSFNEAKYITFSMLVFCSVWIAAIPAYLSTKGKYMVAVEIFAILTSSAGLLGCIFLPKCYIILFRPELNTQTGLLMKKDRY